VGGEVANRVTITNRDVIRDSAVQLGLTHQRSANGVDSSTCAHLEAQVVSARLKAAQMGLPCSVPEERCVRV
jgi:hypothetical protein